MSERPWNWCHKCRQPVDVDADSVDGSEHKCWGCDRMFTLVAFTDDTWGLFSERQQQRMTQAGNRRLMGFKP